MKKILIACAFLASSVPAFAVHAISLYDNGQTNYWQLSAPASLPAKAWVVVPLTNGTTGQILQIGSVAGSTVTESWGVGAGAAVAYSSTVVLSAASQLNFTGSGVSVTVNGTTATITIIGGGGSSNLIVSTNGVMVTNPTSQINFMPPILVSLNGSTTAQVTLNSSSVTMQGPIVSSVAVNAIGTPQLSTTGVMAGSYIFTNLTVGSDGRITAASNGNPILNQSGVQAGAVFNVSSGTVAALNIGTATINLPMGNLQVNGSSQIVTNQISLSSGVTGSLPAASIASGSLGAGVIVSSVAVGTVGIAQLSATGSPSASTFLRGDNTFAAVGGGGSSSLGVYANGVLISSPTSALNVVGASVTLQGLTTAQISVLVAGPVTDNNNVIGLNPISLSTGVVGSLPAASVAAGSLGAGVIASSVAVGSIGSAQLNPPLTISSVTIPALNIGTATYNAAQGVMQVNGSSQIITQQVSLSTEVTGSLPAASIAAGSLGASVLASSFTQSGPGPGSCTNCNATFDAQGRVTIYSNGSAGGGGGGTTIVLTTGTSSGYGAITSTSITTGIFDQNTFKATFISGNTEYFTMNSGSVTLQGPIVSSVAVNTINSGQVVSPINIASVTINVLTVASETVTGQASLATVGGNDVEIGSGTPGWKLQEDVSTTGGYNGIRQNNFLGDTFEFGPSDSLGLNGVPYGAPPNGWVLVDVTNNRTDLAVDQNGNIGIGTYGPISKLDLSSGVITLEGTGAGLNAPVISNGVLKLVGTSHSMVTNQVSLSSEVVGSLPAASIAAGSLGTSVIASSVAQNSNYVFGATFTFTAASTVAVNGVMLDSSGSAGTTNYVWTSQGSGQPDLWKAQMGTGSGVGDNMGNEVATTSMTMKNNGIFQIGTSSSGFRQNGDLSLGSALIDNTGSAGTNGQILVSTGQGFHWAASSTTIGFSISAGTFSAIPTGSTVCVTVQYAVNFSTWFATGGDSSGSITVHISTASYSAYAANGYAALTNISGSNSPSISSSYGGTGSVSSWTTQSIGPNAEVCGIVDSASTFTWATITIPSYKTQ